MLTACTNILGQIVSGGQLENIQKSVDFWAIFGKPVIVMITIKYNEPIATTFVSNEQHNIVVLRSWKDRIKNRLPDKKL